jgi:membrane protease YdiL (CAAX protease family)
MVVRAPRAGIVRPRTIGKGPGPGAARGQVRASHWVWRRWTRWPFTVPMLWVAAIAVTVDAVTAWAGISMGRLGRVPMSPALPLGLLLAGLMGLRRLGLDRTNRRAWREFLVVGTAVLAYAVVSYGSLTGRWAESVGLVVAALGEELIYRLAVIVVIGALCARLLHRDWRNASEWGIAPGLVALFVGSVVFSAMPGHVAQMSDTLHALPFASLGLVLGYAVLRTGALIPAAIVHALLNIETLSVFSGHSTVGLRNALSATALVALVSATVVAGLRLGILHREPAHVDLTAEASSA